MTFVCDPCYSACFATCRNKRCECPQCGGRGMDLLARVEHRTADTKRDSDASLSAPTAPSREVEL